MQLSFLNLENNHKIAYHKSEGSEPCVIFMGGFKSDMTGSKATALEDFCKKRSQKFIRFDYTGHGKSNGEFKDGTISQWKRDALAVIDNLGSERNILVGSSMGAWIALLCALERKEKCLALVGVASAPDFTEKLIWEKLSPEQQAQMTRDKIYYAPSCYGEEPYPITINLLEDGRKNLLLGEEIALNIPVRLLHGTLDEDVPYQVSIELMDKLTSDNITLKLIKNGNHRLSTPEQLNMICEAVAEFL